MTINRLFLDRCNSNHNIDQHLPLLRDYASRCSHITEFGADIGFSTTAFLAAQPKVLHSYDLEVTGWTAPLLGLARDAGINYQFHQADTLTCPIIEETDLLFVDTEHTYKQVKGELERHGEQVRSLLIFHDVISCPEIIPAIVGYTCEGWKLVLWSPVQSGLAVYERTKR